MTPLARVRFRSSSQNKTTRPQQHTQTQHNTKQNAGPRAPGDVHRAALRAPERAAGGSAAEVAAANPSLAAAAPAAVGGRAADAGSGGGSGGHDIGLRLDDASGMDVPELAVLPPVPGE